MAAGKSRAWIWVLSIGFIIFLAGVIGYEVTHLTKVPTWVSVIIAIGLVTVAIGVILYVFNEKKLRKMATIAEKKDSVSAISTTEVEECLDENGCIQMVPIVTPPGAVVAELPPTTNQVKYYQEVPCEPTVQVIPCTTDSTYVEIPDPHLVNSNNPILNNQNPSNLILNTPNNLNSSNIAPLHVEQKRSAPVERVTSPVRVVSSQQLSNLQRADQLQQLSNAQRTADLQEIATLRRTAEYQPAVELQNLSNPTVFNPAPVTAVSPVVLPASAAPSSAVARSIARNSSSRVVIPPTIPTVVRPTASVATVSRPVSTVTVRNPAVNSFNLDSPVVVQTQMPVRPTAASNAESLYVGQSDKRVSTNPIPSNLEIFQTADTNGSLQQLNNAVLTQQRAQNAANIAADNVNTIRRSLAQQAVALAA